MTSLILARHGQGVANVEGIAAGVNLCRGLTAAGRAQAETLGRRLITEQVTRLLCSPIPRGLETAQIVSQTIGVEVEVCDRLRETDYGSADGKLWSDITGTLDYPAPLHPETPIAEGAESATESARRVARVVEGIVTELDHDDVAVIIGHGHTVEVASRFFNETAQLASTLEMYNAALTIWQLTPVVQNRPEFGSRWSLLCHNDSGHLKKS